MEKRTVFGWSMIGWLVAVFAVALPVMGDPPGWTVTPGAYDYDGSVSAAVYRGAVDVGADGDTLGAFVGEECRGYTGALETPVHDWVFMLTVYSDQAGGETMSFKYYDADADMICDITETVVFSPDTTIGSAFDPFVMHVANCPPYVPSGPVPADTSTGVSIDHDLAWVGGDPDTGDSVTYYVYFGIAVDPPCHDTTDTHPAATSDLAYVLPTLQEGETYYWKIVAEDRQGRTAAGSIWRFTVAPGAVEPATWSSIKALYR